MKYAWYGVVLLRWWWSVVVSGRGGAKCDGLWWWWWGPVEQKRVCDATGMGVVVVYNGLAKVWE